MIRSYALVIMDKQDKIIDRFNLDLVTNPTGNGFELELSTISTDIEDIITKVTQKKPTITMTVSQVKNAYLQANILSNWIQKYSTADSQMFLEYNDTQKIKYCSGKVTKLTKTEKNEYRELAQDLTFTMTTPFFEKKEQNIKIEMSAYGKKYPYKYPYSYGKNIVENNKIDNQYIFDIPLIVVIYGSINNPTIDLLDENGNRYSRVKFDGVTIAEKEQLVINSAQKKIYKISEDGTETDYRPRVSPEFDTYLLAKRGISSIFVNDLNLVGTGFKLIGSWRQYTL